MRKSILFLAICQVLCISTLFILIKTCQGSLNRWGKCTLRLTHGHENRQATKLPFKINCLWIQSESSFKNTMASVCSVLQILVKAIIKWSNDVCSSTPFFKLVPLGWFKFLFQKVLMQSFIKWLVWISVTKKHLILHSMSSGFCLFVLVLNISHSSLRAKVFWIELLVFFSGVNFLCAHPLTVLLFKEILKFNDKHER